MILKICIFLIGILISFFLFWICLSIVLIPIFLLYRFWFFGRNPKRKIPEGNNILAPADGRILYIKEISNGEILFSVKNNEKIVLEELIENPDIEYNLVIGIFMTPFSVHQNRIPFDCKVKKMIYNKTTENFSMTRGWLNLLFNLQPLTDGIDYILQNERCTTVIQGDYVDGAVVQIADKKIRKIENNCNVGDDMIKGHRYGMIKYGSQCDLFLKIKGDYKILIKERDYVKAGSSILIKRN